jgi:hypothetical protein
VLGCLASLPVAAVAKDLQLKLQCVLRLGLAQEETLRAARLERELGTLLAASPLRRSVLADHLQVLIAFFLFRRCAEASGLSHRGTTGEFFGGGNFFLCSFFLQVLTQSVLAKEEARRHLGYLIEGQMEERRAWKVYLRVDVPAEEFGGVTEGAGVEGEWDFVSNNPLGA